MYVYIYVYVNYLPKENFDNEFNTFITVKNNKYRIFGQDKLSTTNYIYRNITWSDKESIKKKKN